MNKTRVSSVSSDWDWKKFQSPRTALPWEGGGDFFGEKALKEGYWPFIGGRGDCFSKGGRVFFIFKAHFFSGAGCFIH